MSDEASDHIIKSAVEAHLHGFERAIVTLAALKNRSALNHGPTTGGVKPKPASKPADPAFKNALRQRPMRIGLRYIGD